MNILNLFSINNILFAPLGYPLSYIEFFGTIFNLWSVWLVSKNKILSWPVGIIGVVLFVILFYQIQLYSDLLEQIYYFFTGFYGWWLWTKINQRSQTLKTSYDISVNTKAVNIIYLIIIIIGTIILGYITANLHLFFPNIFIESASFPYLDAFTTVLSFAAQILLAKKKIESWYLWILVDIIGIALYFVKGVVFISLLYLIFLILATNGLISWRKIYLNHHQKQ